MMSLFYTTLGQGPPLLILPGLLGMTDNWQSIAQVLSQHFQVWCLDLRNQGKSPHHTAFDYPSMTKDLVLFLQTHQLQNINLLGHSIGGKLAMQYAQTAPHTVQRLIIVDIAPKAYDMTYHKDLFNKLLAIPLATLTTREALSQAFKAVLSDVLLRGFMLKNIMKTASGCFAWRPNLATITKHLQYITQAIPYQQACQMPTLWLQGGKSDYIQPQDHQLMAQLFPRYECQVIHNAGHWPQFDQPQACQQAILTFLMGHPTITP